ncbi:MAG: 2-C-methyl-D-erythritol 2,4-cyclodiphosphate synthase [Candidatus Zixiibacteriota bacterium]
MTDIRIGHGFDAHRLVAGRALTIGGVRIPYERGLEGHSDADVLLHAIMDALLGAAGLPDIGQHFPPSDPKYRGADSAVLLGEVYRLIKDAGIIGIINIDTVLFAEQPKLNPHVESMKLRIAAILDIEPSQVNIKATTTEKMGFIGRGEGIGASAVCLVRKNG